MIWLHKVPNKTAGVRTTTSRQSGFTLLELIIVLSILSFLTINIAINLRNAFRARAKIQSQVASMSAVRDALRIMERDLNLAFHYRDLEEELRAATTKAGRPNPTPTPGVPPPPGFGIAPVATVDPKEAERQQNRINPVTHFLGKDTEMYFPTLNSGRLEANIGQADFVKVGYLTKQCTPPGREKSSQCLFRRQSNIVEGDIDKGGDDVFLLADVTEFALRYFGKGKQDWNKDWNTKAADGATKDKFPQAVEITLTTETEFEKNKRKVSMQIVAGIHFPNNADSSNQQAGSP